MRLEEIDRMLPNDFHDAYLEKLTIDYAAAKAVFDLDLLFGVPDGKNEFEREAYRKGRLQLSNLIYCIIEPPLPNSHQRYRGVDGPLKIDAWPMVEMKDKPEKLPEPLPEEAFAYVIYAMTWGTFIYVAGTDASFAWQGDPHLNDSLITAHCLLLAPREVT